MDIKTFDDYKVLSSKKIGITSLLSNITQRDGSHKGGWTRLLKCQLQNLGYMDVTILDNKMSINEFDVIVFDLGAEYSGALNMFGGLDEKVFKRLSEIETYKGELFSWRNELPDISSLESRRTNASTCHAFKATDRGFLGRVREVLLRTKVFAHAYITNRLLIGDSHTPSVWDPSWMIERQDGRTLYRALQSSVISELVQKYSPKEVMIHMSSIDVRHHLCRRPEPTEATMHLVTGLVNQVTPLYSFHGVEKVYVCQTTGIEDTSRELPKTGYYKGKPYYGSWDERNEVRNVFNKALQEFTFITGWEVIKFPDYFFDEKGKLRFDVMEVPQSVHLSPEHYRWNLDKNETRW